MTEQTLAGKVAVITGAGRGIGQSIAMRFAKAGADIAICARSHDALDTVRVAVEALGRRCLIQTVDLARPEQTLAFCEQIKDTFKHIDIIVNNAGIYPERGAFVDSDPALWWQTLEVNVRGPYELTRALVDVMNSGGKIINLTSGKGFSAGANSSAYHVSKAALNMLTDCLANELWSRDNKPADQARSPEAILAQSADALPKGLPAWERVKHPDEVAELALFLAQQPKGGPTGQVYSLARRPL